MSTGVEVTVVDDAPCVSGDEDAGVPAAQHRLPDFDILVAHGVDAPFVEAPIMAAFQRAGQADDLRRELERIRSGQDTGFTELSGDDCRRRAAGLDQGSREARRLTGGGP